MLQGIGKQEKCQINKLFLNNSETTNICKVTLKELKMTAKKNKFQGIEKSRIQGLLSKIST